MLDDEWRNVSDLLLSVHDEYEMDRADERAYLWIRLSRLRAAIDVLVGFEYHVEDLLDTYDVGGDFAAMRFFADVPGDRAQAPYLSRVDSPLSRVRETINRGVEPG